jgi:hypothetical protein
MKNFTEFLNEAIDFQSQNINQLKTALETLLNSNEVTEDELKNFIIEYLDDFKSKKLNQ